MVLNKDAIILFLRKNKEFLEKEFGVTKVALFGSYARAQERQDSDIDLLIEVKVKDFRNRFYLKEFFEKEFGKKVDIGYFDSLKKIVQREIEEELVYA